MSLRRVDHLLIGGGIASAIAARTLREEGADGSIAIIGREPELPYHRPPISKGYLRGEESREQALVHTAAWYDDNDVHSLTRTSVLSLDVGARIARLSTKEEICFENALIATGAVVRRLNVEGSGLHGIHYLRAFGNADAIRRDTQDAEHVVIVGGSYIACEVAASLTAAGRGCTMLMLEAVTLERGFGTAAGRLIQDTLESHGVCIIGSDEVARFEGAGAGDDARVARVITRGGRSLPADAVIAGVGVTPDVTLARRAGLEIGELGGVRVNSFLCTSVTGVYAAGDIAEYDSVLHGRVMRIEHEDVASEQGKTAARNMLGRAVAHDAVPYFFSDLADWVSLEYVGPASEWDAEIVRGDPSDGPRTYWYLKDNRVVAALSLRRGTDLDHARRLIAGGRPLEEGDQSLLADVDSELSEIRT